MSRLLPAPKYCIWTMKESKDSRVRGQRVPPVTRSKILHLDHEGIER
ncbi:MAG: hypothetical protein ACJAVI_005756, partial [Candidatus Azotimanducaceae bacterium]